MYEALKEFIKPEFTVLIPVLYIIGMGVKKSAVRDRLIPYILGGAGVLLCGAYVLATAELSTWQDILLAVFTAAVQGILCAGASVYANQLVKQAGKDE